MSLLTDLGLEGITAVKAMGIYNLALSTQLSANSVIEQAKLGGFSIRRTSALSVIRAARNLQISRPYVNSLPYDVLPSIGRIAITPKRLSTNYQYIISIEGANIMTGNYEEQFLAINSDYPLSKRAAMDRAMDFYYGTEENYPIYISKMGVVDIIRIEHPVE